jgi:hypothetical protein
MDWYENICFISQKDIYAQYLNKAYKEILKTTQPNRKIVKWIEQAIHKLMILKCLNNIKIGLLH